MTILEPVFDKIRKKRLTIDGMETVTVLFSPGFSSPVSSIFTSSFVIEPLSKHRTAIKTE